MSSFKPLFRAEDMGGGFRIHLHRTKAFKTITARLAFQSNLDEKTAARALVPRVLGRGTRRFPTLRELQIELDRLYGATLTGDARKLGERQIVCFCADWVNDRVAGEPLLDQMGALLAELIHEPATDPDGGLRADETEQERKMAADEAAAVVDDKSRYARHRLVEEMCRQETYARPSIGRAKEIEALTVAEVRDAHRRMVGRARADLFLVGDLTWSRALRFCRGLGLHKRGTPARLRGTRRVAAGRVRTIRERKKIGQAQLAMGFRTSIRLDSALYPALVIMNVLFGGSAVGKLFKKVREEASLCYAIHSFTERTKGLLFVQAGIDAKNYGKARRLILKQLVHLQEGRTSEEELALASGILLSSLRSMRDSPGALIEFGLERTVNGAEASLVEVLDSLARVKIKDVARAARTIKLDTVYLLRD